MNVFSVYNCDGVSVFVNLVGDCVGDVVNLVCDGVGDVVNFVGDLVNLECHCC